MKRKLKNRQRVRRPGPTSGIVFEPLVARMLSAELGLEVTHHDDNSRDGMYDLTIHRTTGDEPVEVKTAADEKELEQFEAFRSRGPVRLPGEKSWRVGVIPQVRLKKVASLLGGKLGRAESEALKAAPGSPRRQAASILEATRADGVVWVNPMDAPEPGFVVVQAGWEGFAEPDEEHLIVCVTDLVRRYDRVLQRLCHVEAARRHLVIVTRFGTPMAVQMLLEASTTVVPVTAPEVPSGLTDVWVIGGVFGQGALHYAYGTGWSRVSRRAVSSAWGPTDSAGSA